MPLGEKGFAVSMDALLAFLLLLGALTLLPQPSSWQSTDLYQEKVLGEDLLSVLYLEGTLQSLDENRIAADINRVLPARYSWRLSIRGYEYVAASGDFNLVQDRNFGDAMDSGNFAQTRRLFLVFSDTNAVDGYYNAEIRVGMP